MKKTLTINLGGIVYHIDDDAYRLLDNYLSNLKHYFLGKQFGNTHFNIVYDLFRTLLFTKVMFEVRQIIV